MIVLAALAQWYQQRMIYELIASAREGDDVNTKLPSRGYGKLPADIYDPCQRLRQLVWKRGFLWDLFACWWRESRITWLRNNRIRHTYQVLARSEASVGSLSKSPVHPVLGKDGTDYTWHSPEPHQTMVCSPDYGPDVVHCRVLM
jgi:hypothetical protein